MSSPRDRTAERVEEFLRDGARIAYLGDPPTTRCHGCGCEVSTADAYSGQADGRRVYFCEPCDLEEEPC